MMIYSIKHDTDKNIVYIKIKGRLNFNIAQQYSVEALKIAHQNNCSNFLIDHTETELQAGVYKIHTDGAELEQFGFKNTDKVAIIIKATLDSFSNKVDPDVGWSNFQYFNNIEEALNWLNEA